MLLFGQVERKHTITIHHLNSFSILAIMLSTSDVVMYVCCCGRRVCGGGAMAAHEHCHFTYIFNVWT